MADRPSCRSAILPLQVRKVQYRLLIVMREGLDGWRQPNTVIVNPRSRQIYTHEESINLSVVITDLN